MACRLSSCRRLRGYLRSGLRRLLWLVRKRTVFPSIRNREARPIPVRLRPYVRSIRRALAGSSAHLLTVPVRNTYNTLLHAAAKEPGPRRRFVCEIEVVQHPAKIPVFGNWHWAFG